MHSFRDLFIKYFFIILFLTGFILLFIGNFYKQSFGQHYVLLANSFLHGKLYFFSDPSLRPWDNTSLFNNHYFWPLGIFPALLLLPFVYVFGVLAFQGYLSFPLTLLLFFFQYNIFEYLTKDKKVSLLLSFAYIFSTAYIMIAFLPTPGFFAHTVATVCMFGSFYFIFVKKIPIFAGILFSFGFLTRISLFLGILFFLLYYFVEKENFVKNTTNFLVPVMIGILIFFIYNYARFENIFESGYQYQVLYGRIEGNKEVGMWSLRHFKSNLYFFLLKGPDAKFIDGTVLVDTIKPDAWGMSVIFTSPILLFLAFANMRKKLNIISAVTAFIIAVFLFGTFGLGASQYGYRFALDFQPFLFLILADVFKKRGFSISMMVFVCMSFLFNVFMISHFFNS